MRRTIFMLFDKIRREQKRFNKEKVILFAEQNYAVQFCYVAKKNNFEIAGVMPVNVQGNHIDDYSGVPIVSEVEDKSKYLVTVMFNLPTENLHGIVDNIKKFGFDAVIPLTNDDILALAIDPQQHSYFLDDIDKMLRKGNWGKSIFLRGLNDLTMIMALTLKMKGYVVSGIILDDNQANMQNFNFKDIPLLTLKSAAEQKNGIVIDTLPPNNNADYVALKKNHIFWKPTLADVLAIQMHWGFLQQFYSIFNLDTPINNSDYENQSNMVLSAYDKVFVCILETQRIGGMMTSIEFLTQREDQNNLYLIIPRLTIPNKGVWFVPEKPASKFLLQKFNNVGIVFDWSQKNFWNYFIHHHAHAVTYFYGLWEYERLIQPERYRSGNFVLNKFPITFSAEEEAYGRLKSMQMGITGEYVTFFSRDNAYIKHIVSEEDSLRNAQILRDSSIQDFKLTCDELYQRGFQTVRMGYLVNEEISGNGIIDYSSHYREEILDFYMIAKSKFFVCGFSGINIIATMFHVPLVLTNTTHFTVYTDLAFPTNPKKDRILMLPKKLFDTKKSSFVSLEEQLQFEVNIPDSIERLDYYPKHGYKFIDNTPEEIWEATKEMLLRLEGKFEYTAEERELQEKFQNALNKALKQNPDLIPIGRFISSKFLLKNKGIII